jgi:hypothetical protein
MFKKQFQVFFAYTKVFEVVLEALIKRKKQKVVTILHKGILSSK